MRELKELMIARSEGQLEQADYDEVDLRGRVTSSRLHPTNQDEWTEQQRRSW
jgi:hypothetical protein